MKNKIAYIRDGCGKVREMLILEPLPAGWLSATGMPWMKNWPWASGAIVACSADCVVPAKQAVKDRARKALARFEARIDAAELEWSK